MADRDAVRPFPEGLDAQTADLIRAALDPTEAVQLILPGIGAVLIMTDSRVLIARAAGYHRPKTALRSWPFADVQGTRVERSRHGSGQLVVRYGELRYEAVSLFVAADLVARAEHAARTIAQRAAMARGGAAKAR